MAKSVVYGRERVSAEFNMTPMIDVTFQLIIFFILAGSFASLDAAKLTVPAVFGTDNLQELELPGKLVINVVPFPQDQATGREGIAQYWQISTERVPVGNSSRLVEILNNARLAFVDRQSRDPSLADTQFQVEIRCDKRIHYSQIQPVLSAVAEAGIRRVHYVAFGEKQVS